MRYEHKPVMLGEVLAMLRPRKGKFYIDATLGGAGYSLAIARAAKPGLVFAFDLDGLAISNAERRKKEEKINNLVLINANFRNLSEHIEKYYEGKDRPEFHGIVFDLGLSSAQLSDRRRGFSFQVDAPLDMSFGPDREEAETTYGIVNGHDENGLTAIIREYGEEKFARPIARAILRARKIKRIETTFELVRAIEDALPARVRHKPGIHFATRTFQALRIATNRELESLSLALGSAVNLLAPGGRLVVVSYHSLEDRIVKNFFREAAKTCVCPPSAPACTCEHEARLKPVNKKIITASPEEVRSNPRARSAKLRAAEAI
jgi:16S rRNA (cytosine1402-N4)-methyltransferase